MPNSNVNATVKCPYFRRAVQSKNGRCAVVCDGICGCDEVLNLYRNRAEMYGWLQSCCMGYDFGRCPVAAIHDSKYEKGEG